MKSREKQEARNECAVLKEMRHPNIVSYQEHFEQGSKLYIAMDFADGGDLSTKLAAQRGRLLPEQQVVDWFVQLCLAMKHVHDRKILHRDLKAANIFLTRTGMIKLGDFGIAKVLSNTRDLARTQIGTPYYFSPEICNGRPYNNKSDVWSLGVVLYEMLTLRHPFDGRSMQQLIVKICAGRYAPVSSTYSRELRDLVGAMMSQSQRSRPSVNAILKKPLMQRRISQFLSQTLLADEFSHTVLHGPKRRAPAPKAKKAPKPGVAVRGSCKLCSKDVTTEHDRVQDDDGIYYHTKCVQNDREARRRKAMAGEREEPKPEPAADAYRAKLAGRHEEFIARRRAAKVKADGGGNAADKAAVEEFNARQRAAREYRERAKEDVAAAAPAVQQERSAPPAPKPDDNAEAARKAAVAEFNARQRAAREYRERAKEEVAAAAAAPVVHEEERSAVSAPTAKEEVKPDRKKWALEATHDVAVPMGATVVVAPGRRAVPLKMASRRTKLQEMIAANKRRMREQGGGRVDQLADEAQAPPPPAPLERTIGEILDSQVEDDAGDVAVVEEDEHQPAEDAAYEGMLHQLSLVVESPALIDAEPPVVTEEADEDSGSEFGDDDADTPKVGESVFSRMERARAELEDAIGFEGFMAAYRALQAAYGGESEAIEVAKSAALDSIPGADEAKAELFARLDKLVKIECGIFE